MHDPTDPVGRLLFNVLAMVAEFESDLIKMRTREGRRSPPRVGCGGHQAVPAPGSPPGRALPRRRAHHRRARGVLPVTRSTIYRAAAPPADFQRACPGSGEGSSRWIVTDKLLLARNPDPDSRHELPASAATGGGMVFRTSGTWPRTKALYCYPVAGDEWPDQPDIVESAPIRSCVRRGAAIDLVLDRVRENRSQLVFTTARGREAVFWQSPRTRRQAPPERHHAHRPCRRDHRAGNRRRHPRALRLPVRHPAGHRGQARTDLRRLRPHRRRPDRRGRGTQVPRRSRVQPDQRHAALRTRWSSPHSRARPSSSRTATRRSSPSTGSDPRWSPTD